MLSVSFIIFAFAEVTPPKKETPPPQKEVEPEPQSVLAGSCVHRFCLSYVLFQV